MTTLLLLALAAQAAQPPVAMTNSPPPIVQTNVAPPPIVTAPVPPPILRMPAPRPQAKPVPVEIAVSAGGRPLWSGTLRVGASGANHSMSRSEAGTAICPNPSDWARTERTALTVRLHRDYGNAERFTVQVDWARPAPASDCTATGSRSVELSQGVTLEPGRTVTVEGDANLRITLTRR